MKIGDRVIYDDDSGLDNRGTVVEATAEEIESVKRTEYPELVGPLHGDVMVEWDDGERYWEDPGYLVKIKGVS